MAICNIYIILYYIYVSIYALMAVGVYVCIMYAPTYVPPTDCRTATGAMVKSRRHDASKIAGKKHAVDLGKSTIY